MRRRGLEVKVWRGDMVIGKGGRLAYCVWALAVAHKESFVKKEVAFQRLVDCGMVAVIRAQGEGQLLDIAKALVEGGGDWN